MRYTRRMFGLGMILAAGLLATDLPFARGDDDALRREALKLNDLVGQGMIQARLEALRKQPDHARKLVAAASSLAREKDSALNFTAAFILGELAREHKEIDAGKVLFQVCLNKAELLRSDHKQAIAYLELLNLLFEGKRYDEAEALCKEFLKKPLDENEVDDIMIEEDTLLGRQVDGLAQHPEAASKLVTAARAQLKDKKKTNYTAVYLLAALARELRDVDGATVLLRGCLDAAEKLRSGGKLAVLYIEYIDLLYDNKKYEETEKACKEVLELQAGGAVSIAKLHALMRSIQATALQGKIDEAFKRLDPYLKQFPNEPEVLKIQGWLCLQAGKNDEATRTYEKLLSQAEGEDQKERYRYLLSGLHSEIGNVDKAMTHLRILLQKKPDHPTYNNDLGYMMAEHDMDLDEAERLVRKALDKEPKRASYLDSMGWVLFKKMKYKEAKEYLLQAIRDDEGQHAEIYEHLGDIHKALGEKADAISAWKKAVQLSTNTPREQKRKAEIEKKIKANE